tara:strand:+ start:499 stop:666 length:168 start_codon:yes stop_codon:yes gene_type:complete
VVSKVNLLISFPIKEANLEEQNTLKIFKTVEDEIRIKKDNREKSLNPIKLKLMEL